MKHIAIVTGASSGIGREFVRTIPKHGTFDEVWVIARNQERLEELQWDVSIPLKVVAMDLSDPASFVRMQTLLEEQKSDVRLLINAAGFGRFQAVEKCSLEDNLVLQRYFEPEFTGKMGMLKRKEIRDYAEKLIGEYDIRSGQGPVSSARSMSGGNQQKAVIAREIDRDPKLLIAVQPTRGVDVGAIEMIHRELVKQRDLGKAILLVSLELDEVMDVPDRILVIYEGEIMGEFDPGNVTVEELGLYMTGSRRQEVK